MIRSVASMLTLLVTSPVTTETVDVRGRAVDLAPFACTDTPRSTVVERVCYDELRQHLLVSTGGTYSEYCRLPAATFAAFVVAPSMGQYFRQRVATSAAQFACNAASPFTSQKGHAMRGLQSDAEFGNSTHQVLVPKNP